jgi:hypothetical protein
VTRSRAATPVVLAALVLAALVLAACSGTSPSGTASTATSGGASAAPTAGEATSGGAASGASAEPASGRCANDYQPVAEGDTWTYAMHGSGGESEYTDTVTSASSSSFTITSDFGDVEKDTTWSCARDGLVALQYGGGASGSLTARQLSASFRTTTVTGVTIPASIDPGDSWEQSYELKGAIDLGGAKAVVTGSVVERFNAGNVVDVTVQAGTFRAIAIDTSVTLDLQTTVAGTNTPVRMDFTGRTYLAEGVGMVKSTSAASLFGQKFSTTIELGTYSVD